MPVQRVPMLLWLEGQQEVQRVIVDQRDFAAAEGAGYPDGDERRVVRIRYLAWSAARRAGVTKTTWSRFNDSECMHAEVDPGYDDEDDGEGDSLDPGRPDQPAGG